MTGTSIAHRFLRFSFVCLIWAGCSAPQAGETDSAPVTCAVIFVPGLYGTALVDAATGERFFLTAAKALWSGTPLALWGPDLGIDGARKLVPEEVLRRVLVIPGIFSVDVYGDTLDFLRDRLGSRVKVVGFAYDWRRDCSENGQRLGRQIRSLRAEGIRRVALVSHSMGGLVSSYYLRYGEQPSESASSDWAGAAGVDAVVLGTVPFRGAVSSWRNLYQGTALGLAKTPLAARSMATFPSMFQLLPDPKSYLNAKLQPLPDSIYDLQNWIRGKWGIFADHAAQSPAIRRARENLVAENLKRGRSFAEKLHAPDMGSGHSPLPVLHLVATGHPTLARAVWSADSLAEPGRWAFAKRELTNGEQISFAADGDLTVTTASQQIPSAFAQHFAVETVVVRERHSGIYKNAQVQKRLLGFLNTAMGLPSAAK